MRLSKIFMFLLTMIVVLPSLVFAGGTNRSPIYGARVLALDGLYFAGSDGLSNIYLNPAGLAGIKKNFVEVTGFFKSEQNSFKGDVRGVYNSIREEDGNFGVGFNWSIFKNMTVGLAYEDFIDYKVNWPYTLITKIGGSSDVTTTDMSYKEIIKSISPAISYKVGSFSFGASAHILNIRVESAFAQENYNWIDSISLPIYQINLKKDGWLWNFNLGLTYEFSTDFKLGMAVTNAVDGELEGNAYSKLYSDVDSTKSKVGYKGKYQSPLRVGLGILYILNEQLAFNLDIRYNLYGSLDDELNGNFDDPIWAEKSTLPDTLTGFSAATFPQYYENTIDVGLGLEYFATENFDVAIGYRYSQSPNTVKTFSLLNPTVDQHLFSAGFVYRDNKLIIEGSAVYFIGKKNNVSSSPFEVHNGDYDTSGFIPTISLKYEL